MTEKQFVDKTLKALNAIPNSKFAKTPTGGKYHSGIGWPDVVGHYKGRLVLIEFKLDYNKLSPKQLITLREWQDSGAKCLVLIYDTELKIVRIKAELGQRFLSGVHLNPSNLEAALEEILI